MISIKSALLLLLGVVMQDLVLDYPTLTGRPTIEQVEDAAAYYRACEGATVMAVPLPLCIVLGGVGLLRAVWRRPTAGLSAMLVGMLASLYLFVGRILPARSALAALPRGSTPARAYMDLLMDIALGHALLFVLLTALAAVADREEREEGKRKEE